MTNSREEPQSQRSCNEIKKTEGYKRQRDDAQMELANTLNVQKDADQIEQATASARELEKSLTEENEKVQKFIAPAAWMMGVMQNRPSLLRDHKEYITKALEQPETESVCSDNTAQRIICGIVI